MMRLILSVPRFLESFFVALVSNNQTTQMSSGSSNGSNLTFVDVDMILATISYDMYSWSNVSNTSTMSPFHMNRTTAELIIGSFTFIVIMIMTIIGNTLVILSVITYKPLNKVQNYFLVSLAAADLCVATLVMPFHVVKFLLGKWIFGLVVCQTWLTFDILSCTSSILNLCAIALDRYWAITSPIEYSNKRTPTLVLSMITVVWGLSALISIPPLIGWNDWSDEHLAYTCELTQDKAFVLYSASGSFYIPLLVMTTVYIKIFLAARNRLRSKRSKVLSNAAEATTKATVVEKKVGDDCKQNDQQLVVDGINHTERTPMLRRDTRTSTTEQKSSGSQEEENGQSTYGVAANANGAQTLKQLPPVVRPLEMLNIQKIYKDRERISVSREKKAAKTLAIIMGVFVLCWLPFFLMYVLKPFCGVCGLHQKIEEVITWLGYINSALNPVIYTIFNLDFRRAFHKYLCFWIPMDRRS